MTRKSRLIATAALGALCLAGAAVAQSAVDAAVKARKAHMQLYAFNLGVLGGMAKGEIEYDAERAGQAAGNIAALASLSQAGYWPEGSAQGEAEGSRALPALWTNGDDVMAKGAAFRDAVTALAAAAGTDLASLRGAMGPVGQACGSCHESYRAPE